jgi:hypothetical protein
LGRGRFARLVAGQPTIIAPFDAAVLSRAAAALSMRAMASGERADATISIAR